MSEDMGLAETGGEGQRREELFERPIVERVLESSTGVERLMRAAAQGTMSTRSLAELTEAVQRTVALQTSIAEASNRLVTSLVKPLEELGQIRSQLQVPVDALLSQALAATLEVSKYLNASLRNFQSAYGALVQSYLAPLQGALLRITDGFRPLLDEITRAKARQLESLMRRWHWWPIPGMPTDFYMGILRLLEQGLAGRVNQYICHWFRWNRYRRLGRMVRRWDTNEFFRRRRHIYGQALKAHRRGWYSVTVPALLPLVEGVARDYLQEQHGLSERSGVKAIKQALGKRIPKDVFREEVQQALIRFLTGSTFADTNAGDLLPSGYELNRHGVAHSRHLRYGTEANSLRCFLLLETLFQFIADDPRTPWA